MTATDHAQLIVTVRDGSTVLEPDSPAPRAAAQGTQDRLFHPVATMPGQLALEDGSHA